ncbi:hypothetical protein [Amycolatopsis albispora]|uniref:hypothetical protein n=1 Tax=Amycolatopsis albispora TaxID=1804986 RepID=UPI0013B4195B|nr:hypothetical protein [Amycolatopsis albispora]
MTETEAGARRKPSALELIAECVVRLRMTDPTDTGASLLAAWHGFGIAESAGRMLREDNDDVTASTLAALGVAPLRVMPGPDAAELALLARTRGGCRPTAAPVSPSAPAITPSLPSATPTPHRSKSLSGKDNRCH